MRLLLLKVERFTIAVMILTIATAIVALALLLSGKCISISYSPHAIPIEISVDASGRLSLKAKGTLVTPLGNFSVESNLASASEQFKLIVIVKDQLFAFPLGDRTSGNTFSVKVETFERASTTIRVEDCQTILVRIETEGPIRVGETILHGFVCPDTLPPRLSIGARGYVNSNPIKYLCRMPSSGPCPDSERVDAIGRGARFTVVDGPVCRGGYVWWKVDPDDPRKPTAWTPEANSREYWISPIN